MVAIMLKCRRLNSLINNSSAKKGTERIVEMKRKRGDQTKEERRHKKEGYGKRNKRRKYVLRRVFSWSVHFLFCFHTLFFCYPLPCHCQAAGNSVGKGKLGYIPPPSVDCDLGFH
jgi:hypothetical protein